MNFNFNGTQPISVRASFTVSGNDRPHPDLLPLEKGQRLQASLYAVVRRANPVAGACWFRGSRHELFRGNPPVWRGREMNRARRQYIDRTFTIVRC